METGMITGPYPKGHWTDVVPPEDFHGGLAVGRRYRVTREFLDYDADPHPVGETWTFLGCNFLPYEDGWSFFVSLDGEHEWHIRLQDRGETQAAILQDLGSYVAEIDSPWPPKRDPNTPASSF